MDQPPVVDYRGPHQQPKRPPQNALLWFMLGLVVGVLVSLLVWVPMFSSQDAAPVWVYLAWLIPIKAVVGMTMAFLPDWRWFGLGLLASVPIGFVIFFMSCAANFHM